MRSQMSRPAQCISLRSFYRHEDRPQRFVSAALPLAGTRLHSAPLTDSPLFFHSALLKRCHPRLVKILRHQQLLPPFGNPDCRVKRVAAERSGLSLIHGNKKQGSRCLPGRTFKKRGLITQEKSEEYNTRILPQERGAGKKP